jgi:hypothetical protein
VKFIEIVILTEFRITTAEPASWDNVSQNIWLGVSNPCVVYLTCIKIRVVLIFISFKFAHSNFARLVRAALNSRK